MMKLTWHWIAAICLAASWCGAENAPDKSLPGVTKIELRNGDFSAAEIGKKPTGWSLWTRAGVTLNVTTVQGQTEGQKAVRLQSAGERDWAFTNNARIPVKTGQAFRLTCRARAAEPVANRVNLQVMSFSGGKQVSYKMADLLMAKLGTDIQDYPLEFIIPAEIDTIAVRLVGTGSCDLLVNGMMLTAIPPESIQALRTPPPPLLPPVSRPVQGWAKTPVKEKLGRGLIATPTTDKQVYLSWRLLDSDDPKIGFDVFSAANGSEVKLNAAPLVQTTDYMVEKPVLGARYTVRPATGFSGVAGTAAVREVPNPDYSFVRYKLSNPNAQTDKVAIGDLDGDGEYDYVVRYNTNGANVDPWYAFWKPSQSTYTLEAVKSDGTILWTKDLGWNIECGIWYSPYIVYDINGDGKAEIILKAFDPAAGDLREKDGPDKGKVMTGAEYLMVLDGMTGKELARAPWPDRKNFAGMNMEYNYYSRNQLAIGYLDGKTPCIIALRGTYSLMLADAWQLKDGKLESLWKYNNKAYGHNYFGQGAHTTRTVDLNGDGRDEIILGGAVLNSDGTALWSTGHGHPDYVYVTKITNSHPGMEVVTMYETACKRGGVTCADAKTGKVIWEFDQPTTHLHIGCAGEIDPHYRGWMIGTSDVGTGDDKKPQKSYFFSPEGKLLATDAQAPFNSTQHFIYWDADLQREIAKPGVTDFGGGPSGGGYEGRFIQQADILGDWREEAITAKPGEIRIYSTLIPAMDRRCCLMQDHDYRMTVAVASMGYHYDPALSYLPTNLAPNLNLTYQEKKTGTTLEVIVTAPLSSPLKGTLKLLAPAGMSLNKTEWPIDLKPGAMSAVVVEVKKSAPTLAPIKAELSLADGTILRGQVATGKKAVIMPPIAGAITQAEDIAGEQGGKVVIRSDKAGVYGKCFSHWDKAGHTLTWNLSVPNTGLYHLALRYGCPSEARRMVTLDGNPLGEFKFPAGGGNGDSPDDWQLFRLSRNASDMVFNLKKGAVVLQMENVGDTPMNLDLIQLIPVR